MPLREWLFIEVAADAMPQSQSRRTALFEGDHQIDTPGPKPPVGTACMMLHDLIEAATRLARSKFNLRMRSMWIS